MAYGTRAGLILVAGLMAVSSPAGAVRQQGAQGDRPLPDFDIRDQRPPAAATAEATAELQRRDPSGGRTRQARLHGRTGAIRVLDYPGLTASPLASAGAK